MDTKVIDERVVEGPRIYVVSVGKGGNETPRYATLTESVAHKVAGKIIAECDCPDTSVTVRGVRNIAMLEDK